MTRQEKKQLNEGKEYTNKRGEKMIVKTFNNSMSVLVLFPDTNTEKWTRMDTIRSGEVKNPTHGSKQPSIIKSIIGKIFTNSIGLKYRILKQEEAKSLIEFENTQNRKWVTTDAAKLGKIRDEFHKSILGVACMGKTDDEDPYKRKKYNLWYKMLTRCLGLGDNPESYKKVTIYSSWQCFANFQIDVENIPGYKNWLTKHDIELDKDLFSNGKGYYPESCAFITGSLNVKLRGMSDAEIESIKRSMINEHRGI